MEVTIEQLRMMFKNGSEEAFKKTVDEINSLKETIPLNFV